uniref:Uncharacterized protein n=1 Tax=Meloidogyne enterolobii TaxID=390850 RepID=A0A6V7XW32_MELEN|nr:unnamed protein product [Meloidogyne enterolobii]
MRPTTKFIFPLWTQILFLRLKNFYTTQNPIRGLPSFFIISIQFSSLIAIFTSTFCCTIWFLFWTGFDELSISNRSYLLILLVFSFSVCIELLAEPIIIEQLKSGRTRNYVFNGAILLLLHKFLTIVLLLFKINPLVAFSLSQLIASLVYFYLFIRDNKKNIFKIYKTSILQFFNLKRFDEGRLQLLKVYLFHSILKQFSDGRS